MSKKNFIDTLYKKRSAFIDQDQAEMVANLLDTVSSDIYSESQRFIFELIQNADDAAIDTNNELQFDFFSNCIMVSHNGKAFDEKDIISLTGAGASTKKADSTKTGYKGIGFKSVFGKSERVTIFSDGYQFRFDKSVHKTKLPWQIIPLWTYTEELEKEVQKNLSLNKYSVSTIIEINKSDALLSDLIELLCNGQILLFLRQISKISISKNGEKINTIEKKIINEEEAYKEVEIHSEGKKTSTWITKTFEKIQISEETKLALSQDEKTPEKLKEADYTEISFAAKIEEGKIKELKGNESLIFTYLPTSVSKFQFPFLINGSFLTTANRQDIHSDRIWNQWLFMLIAEKIVEWIEILAKSKFVFQILHLIPQKQNGFQNELRRAFDISLEKHAKNKSFVPNKSQNLKKPSEIIIDRTGLSDLNFISIDTVVDFINQKEKTNFKRDSFINTKLLRVEKLRAFGSKYFEIENLESFFISQIFKVNHNPSENFSLIEYFYTIAKESRDWNDRLKRISFIYTEEMILKTPKAVCFPSVSFETEFGDGVSVIHKDVYLQIEQNSKVRKWLEFLGVKEPSDLAYIENEIIGNIGNSINYDNCQRVTRYIFNQHKKSLLDDWHYRSLNNLKILTTKNEFKPAKECYLSDFYAPILKLEKANKHGAYVSETYRQKEDLISEWQTFFVKIGVGNDISWEYKEFSSHTIEVSYPDFFNNNPQNAPYNGYNNYFHTYKVQTLRFIELTINDYTFSKLFWTAFIKSGSNILPNGKDYGLHFFGSYGDRSIMLNYLWIKNFYLTQNCFPTTLRDNRSACQIFINDKEIKEIAGRYLPVLDFENIPDDDWLRHVPFKQKLVIEDYLDILFAIVKDTENDEELKNVNKKRLGLIYNKLTSLIPDLSVKKKNIITEWADCNKLLCDSGSFENANELKWVKIVGFTNTSNHLKRIFIPENCDTNSNEFEELLQLFGVKIIDSFIPDIKNKVPETTLKIQLQVVLPFLTAIIERKHYLDYSIEFNRLHNIIDNTEFYTASEIILSFKNQDEIILGPSLHAYLTDSELSFKGKWTSPVTLYALIPELLKLFNISDLNEELKLLLQLNESEIEEWSIEQGYDVNAIKEKPEYEVSIKKVKLFKDEKPIEQTTETIDVSIINEFNALNKLLKSKNISVEQLMQLISDFDADEIDENISISSKEHLDQKGKNEENRVARELVYQRLISEGFEFTDGMGGNSVVNGVCKDNIEYPLVVKSYRNTSYKFNIRPNEWIQLSKPNAMFWVHRGNGKLEVLNLEGLLRANSEFHVQFETAAFSFDGLVKFAEVFRFVKNVHFQLDAPNFSIAKAFEEYKFDKRENGMIEKGSDNQELLH